jgi:hypothetical protein
MDSVVKREQNLIAVPFETHKALFLTPKIVPVSLRMLSGWYSGDKRGDKGLKLVFLY